jgi:predicted nucleotidyltransferase
MTQPALILDDPRPIMERVREWIGKVNAKIPLTKVLLFGSTAKGTRTEESDVDLIVISKSFKGVHELDRLEMLLHLWSFVEELNILAYTPEEFNKVKDRFMMRKILSYALDLTPKRQSTTIKSTS